MMYLYMRYICVMMTIKRLDKIYMLNKKNEKTKKNHQSLPYVHTGVQMMPQKKKQFYL